jgi:DNA-3-methyladenine glycosylase
VVAAARELLGWELLVDGVGGRIIECEAYAPGDEASHAFRGRTARNASMFAGPGTLYVYRSYGIHWCLNIVCGPEGFGAAVLVRALAPTAGLEVIASRRAGVIERDRCRGPGRVGLALGVDASFDGAVPGAGRFELREGEPPARILCGPRIGITRAAERPWRFASGDDLRLVSGPTAGLRELPRR